MLIAAWLPEQNSFSMTCSRAFYKKLRHWRHLPQSRSILSRSSRAKSLLKTWMMQMGCAIGLKRGRLSTWSGSAWRTWWKVHDISSWGTERVKWMTSSYAAMGNEIWLDPREEEPHLSIQFSVPASFHEKRIGFKFLIWSQYSEDLAPDYVSMYNYLSVMKFYVRSTYDLHVQPW